MENNIMKQLKVPVIPVDVEGERLLSFLGSQLYDTYMNTRIYKDDKQAVNAFVDGVTWCVSMMMSSPNKIHGALVFEDEIKEFTNKIK